jgi:hypothetical protein
MIQKNRKYVWLVGIGLSPPGGATGIEEWKGMEEDVGKSV